MAEVDVSLDMKPCKTLIGEVPPETGRIKESKSLGFVGRGSFSHVPIPGALHDFKSPLYK